MAEVNGDVVEDLIQNPKQLMQSNGNLKQNSIPQTPKLFDDSVVTELSLGLSLGNEIYEEKPKCLIRSSSSANGGLYDLNEKDMGFLSLERSSSMPSQPQWMMAKGPQTVAADDAGKIPAVAAELAAVTASKNSAFCRAMGRIKTAKKSSPSSPMMQDNSKAVAKRKSTSLRGPVGCRVMKNGIYDVTAGLDSPNPPAAAAAAAKRSRVSDETTIIQGMTGMELLTRMMPGVSATGDGPNGRRIEGFLCSYMKGNVCIVCVCHGDFLTPAEFIKHAGGSGAANPMKSITVSPPPF